MNFVTVLAVWLLFAGTFSCTQEADEVETEEVSSEELAWNQRIEAAFVTSDCPTAPEPEFDATDYIGPLIDSHVHIPALPDSPIGDEEGYADEEISPLLGVNITITDIACTLQWEGTEKVFAFFPVYSNISWQLLEVAQRTRNLFPTLFVPFIMPPGPDDIPPTVDATELTEMLENAVGIFQGYGEIGLYEREGRAAEDYPPNAQIFLDIYPVVRAHNLMVYFHPGEGHAEELEEVLDDHPDINVIVHGEQVEEVIGDLMNRHTNLSFTVNDLYGDQYLLHAGETTESFLEATEDYETLLEIDLANWKDLIEAHPDQFLWGTDRGGVAVWTFDQEVGARLVDYARAFIGRLNPSVQEKFAYQNAERLSEGSGE